ncbi:hypothetical protein SO802_012127 [Lithocarpus litseifolius]|uniref:Uncharacterized protein n=1 Tax=Lithocarpus litseifolius TaxID=425828 RepID=A0AAW2D7B1_9ROSI
MIPLSLRSKDLGLGILLWLWWFEAWAVVELVHLDFLVEVVVLVEGYWFSIGGDGAWLMMVDSRFAVGGGIAGFRCSWV